MFTYCTCSYHLHYTIHWYIPLQQNSNYCTLSYLLICIMKRLTTYAMYAAVTLAIDIHLRCWLIHIGIIICNTSHMFVARLILLM